MNDTNSKRVAGARLQSGRCQGDFPCLVSIHVFAGLQPACEVCAPYIQEMRESGGWQSVGRFWLSRTISAFQTEALIGEIQQAQIDLDVPTGDHARVVMDPEGEFPACRPFADGGPDCVYCGGSVFNRQAKVCPAATPAERWTFKVRPLLCPCPRCGDASVAQWLDSSWPENTSGSFGCDTCGWMARCGQTKTEAADHWNAGLFEPQASPPPGE